MYFWAGSPVSVGLTDVIPQTLKTMTPKNFDIAICGQFDDPELEYTNIDMVCPGGSVVGRYLVVQTQHPSTGGHTVCEVWATVEGT